jgi:hypothetical protein
MSENYGKFRHHKYTWTHPFGGARHHWELVGPSGAIHFHVNIMDDQQYQPTAGLEFHHPAGHPTYAGQAPHHLKCWLTGGACWHDGTSLYAREHVWPMVEGYLRAGDHQAIFRILEREYCQHFDRTDGDDE